MTQRTARTADTLAYEIPERLTAMELEAFLKLDVKTMCLSSA